MPRAGPSSSSRRRQPRDPDDDEEMINGTQNNQRNQNQDEEQEDDDEEQEQAGGGINRKSAREIVEELKPQPLDITAEPTLKGLQSNYNNFKSSITASMSNLKEAIIATEDLYAGNEFDPEDDQIFKDADFEFRVMLDLIAEAEWREKALKEIQAKVARGEEIRDANELYTETIGKDSVAYKSKTPRQKYLKNELYEEFRSQIWEPRRDDRGPMPSLPDLLPQEEGDEDDSDDDIRVGGVSRDYKCPITTILLENPVTNSNCKHSYSKSAIMEFINSKEKKCPVSGCQKEVTKSSIKENKALSKAVQQHKRRMEAKEDSRRATQAAGATMID